MDGPTSNSWGRAREEQGWSGVHLGCVQLLLVTSCGACFWGSFFNCQVGMATVSRLIRRLVSFHGMMLVKCLKQCLASSRPSINTDFTDVGETAEAK